jgi:peptide/nickel transport system permease protein
MIPILFGITLLVFLLFNVAGGDPAAKAAGRYATQETIATMRAEMGLDRPLMTQYFDLLRQISNFDLGRSWSSHQQISSTLVAGLGPTLTVMLSGFVLSLLLSVPLALFVAHRRNTRVDKLIMIACLAGISISSLAYVLVGQYIFSYKFGWFPIQGWDPSFTGRWQFAALPILIFVLLSLGSDILFYRTVFIEELFQDYVRTARSKGLSEWKVMTKHVLRNGLVPIITMIAIQLPFLLVGSLLIESFYGIPGLGGITYIAIQEADFPVIKAMTIVGALLYMIVQLVSDILYGLVDPKIRVG